MNFFLMSTVMIAVILSAAVDSSVNAITVNNTDFSVTVLDNWVYTKPSNPLANIFGGGSTLTLIPTEFSRLLVDAKTDFQELSRNLSVFSSLMADTDYPYRNVPLEIYVQYRFNLSVYDTGWALENTTIDGDKALKIYGDVTDDRYNIDEALMYFVIHEGVPYRLEYYASEKEF